MKVVLAAVFLLVLASGIASTVHPFAKDCHISEVPLWVEQPCVGVGPSMLDFLWPPDRWGNTPKHGF